MINLKNKTKLHNSSMWHQKQKKSLNFNVITIGIASPLKILQWAEKTLPNGKVYGEVYKPNTLHHKTFKPYKGGLFCERIFGPLKDFTCACGKVNKPPIRGSKFSRDPDKFVLTNPLLPQLSAHEGKSPRQYCPDCDVEYTWSAMRRYQLGYIKLCSPVLHVWYFRGSPSYLSLFLDMKKRHLQNLAYCSEALTIDYILSNDSCFTNNHFQKGDSHDKKTDTVFYLNNRTGKTSTYTGSYRNKRNSNVSTQKNNITGFNMAHSTRTSLYAGPHSSQREQKHKISSTLIIIFSNNRFFYSNNTNREKNNISKVNTVFKKITSNSYVYSTSIKNVYSSVSKRIHYISLLSSEKKQSVFLYRKNSNNKISNKKVYNPIYTVSYRERWVIYADSNGQPRQSANQDTINNSKTVSVISWVLFKKYINISDISNISNISDISKIKKSGMSIKNTPNTHKNSLLLLSQEMKADLKKVSLQYEKARMLFYSKKTKLPHKNSATVFVGPLHSGRLIEDTATGMRSSKEKNRMLLEKKNLITEKAKLVTTMYRKEKDPVSMILTLLPVLPPDLRPIVKISGNNSGSVAASDLNRLYQSILYRNQRLKVFQKNLMKTVSTHNKKQEKVNVEDDYNYIVLKHAQRLLQEAVDNLIQNNATTGQTDSRGRALKSLSDTLKGKQGRFRQFLLGKRVDYSGRSVVVVGPKLQMHECGIPVEMAKVLYLPFLMRQILNRKYALTLTGAKLFIKQNPVFILELLREVLHSSPVLLNRAPTLHRLGIQAFIPKLVTGKAILLHPLVCSAFNADFDGDQMAVHVPITVEARAEAWKLMLARNNIFSPATGEPLAIPSQDMVLGCYYLTAVNPFIKSHNTTFFNNFDDVLTALNQNQITIHSNVWVKWNGLVYNPSGDTTTLNKKIKSFKKERKTLKTNKSAARYCLPFKNAYNSTLIKNKTLYEVRIALNCKYIEISANTICNYEIRLNKSISDNNNTGYFYILSKNEDSPKEEDSQKKNVLVNQLILTTPGRVLYNKKLNLC